MDYGIYYSAYVKESLCVYLCFYVCFHTGRTYWIADMAWSADGLLLICVTRRGCLMIMPQFGRPLKLVIHGCSLDMGPNYFLPLHPLITVVYVVIWIKGSGYC